MRTIEQKEHQRLYMQKKRAASPELRQKNREYSRKYCAEHKDERNAYSKQYRLKRDYNMTIDEFREMLAYQNGKCCICEVVMDPPARCTRDSIAVTVDHCHDTGKVRGLLCYSCNLGLGIFKDSLKRLRLAVAYMEKAKQAIKNEAVAQAKL